jgi:DNA-binding SARP family transcriptional activator
LIEINQSRLDRLTSDIGKLKAAQYKPEPIKRPLMTITSDETYRVRVQTLGLEFIERDGTRLSTSDWRATTARELFLYTLFNGPGTREEISLAFIYEDNLYQLNPAVEIRCDAQELESLTTQARLLSPRDARTEDLWRKAADLYQGEFLPSIHADWVWMRRDNLHEAYIEALIGLGECARARGDVRAALNAFKRALDKEPYREDINRSIMICYADLGEKHQIISQLNNLRRLLQEELAVEPSPETIELANRLLA